MNFVLNRLNGVVQGANRIDDDGREVSFTTRHPLWAEFLTWNSAQPVPLDLSDIAPQPMDPDLVLAVQILKAIPAAWKTGTQQQQIAWATRRVLIEMRNELRD